LVSFSDLETLVIILVSGVLGVVNAMILKTLSDNGILVDAMIENTITLTDLMTLVVVIWLVGGILVSVIKR
jgi:hypothetical protein